MLVRFLAPRKTDTPHKSLQTLLEHPSAHLLSGSPDLCLALTESLLFSNSYLVGYLAFEEKTLPQHHKYQIIQQFEASFLAGLEGDRYCACWIEQTKQEHLRLYFFIPLIELRTKKRLTPYYHRSDRSLCEAFQRVINLTYGLTAPDDPQKRQTIKIANNLPETIKTSIRALNELIEQQFKQGHIHKREDVVLFLERSGFELTNKTAKTLSVKHEDGMNIRLRGSFYEQDFGINQNSGAIRSSESKSTRKETGSESRTAWERLEYSIGRKIQKNRSCFKISRKEN